MTKDALKTVGRVAALELEVDTSFRDVCRMLGHGRSRSHLPDEVLRLQGLAQEANGIAQSHAEREQLAQRHFDEVKQAQAEVAQLRKRAGASVTSFRRKFEKAKAGLDGQVLAEAASNVRGVSAVGGENLQRLVLHLLRTPRLVTAARAAAAAQQQKDDENRRIRCDPGMKEDGYWLRADAMLSVVEALGRGFAGDQLQALYDLDVTEGEFQQLVERYAKIHQGKPWQEWPEVWSAAKQADLAKMALEQFAKAFVAAKCHEDIPPSQDQSTRWACRRYEQAVAQLAIARVEARVDALEAKLVGESPQRPRKTAPRAISHSPKPAKKTKKGRGRRGS